jgi:hypothetical protein
VNRAITEHPQFSRIQWNQSYSHMPRIPRALAADAERVEEEPMDMDGHAAEQEGEEETVTMGDKCRMLHIQAS